MVVGGGHGMGGVGVVMDHEAGPGGVINGSLAGLGPKVQRRYY